MTEYYSCSCWKATLIVVVAVIVSVGCWLSLLASPIGISVFVCLLFVVISINFDPLQLCQLLLLLLPR